MRIDYVLAGIVVAILIILALQFLPDDDAAPPPEIQAPSQAPPPSDPEPVPSAVTDVPPQEAVAPTVVPEPLAPPLPELCMKATPWSEQRWATGGCPIRSCSGTICWRVWRW